MVSGRLTFAEFVTLPTPPEGRYELRHGRLALTTFAPWECEEIQDQVQTLLKRRLHGRVRMQMGFSRCLSSSSGMQVSVT